MTTPDRWLLSFYRASEIQGALFFGRLARTLRDPALLGDMTQHFADEARHAQVFTECLRELGLSPCDVGRAYQDAYLDAAGLPGSIMEVLALTHVFERRVMRQYARHLREPGVDAAIVRALESVMIDERRHVAWTGAALDRLRAELGSPAVDAALARFRAADELVHDAALSRWTAEMAELQEAAR